MLSWIKSSFANRSMKRWLRDHPVFASSCKISTKQKGSPQCFRASIVVACDNLFDAEKLAESIVQKWLDLNRGQFDGPTNLKWRKGHQLTSSTFEMENPTVLRLLEELRSKGCGECSAFEEIATEDFSDPLAVGR